MMANTRGWKCLVISITALVAFDVVVVCGEIDKDLRKNLLLYYDFDNMTQTHVYDRSGNGRSARMYNTNIVEEEGKCNKSITFNSQPLHITEVASPNATSVKRSSLQITVAVWILLYEGKGKRTIFTSFHASKEKKFLYFGIYKDNYLRWFATSENSCKTFEKASQLKVGAWQHVAVSYNYTNGITTCNFFVNGTLFEGKGNNKDSKLTAKNTPLGISPFIGSVNSQGGEPLNGLMDEFYIFDKALSKEEIQNLMNDTCKTNQNATIQTNPRNTTSHAPTRTPPNTTPTDKTTEMVASSTYPTTVQTTKMVTTSPVYPTTVHTTKMVNMSPTYHPTTLHTTKMVTTSPVYPTTVHTTKMVNTSPTYHPTTVHPTKVNGTETSQLKEAEKIKSKDAAKKFLTEIVGEQIVVRNDSRGETNSAIKFTKLLEDIGLTLARNTLKVNESQTVDTPSTFLLMNKPVSGFTFPSVEQQSAKKIDETISFPDDLVKTDDGVQRAFVCMAYSNLHENMASEFTISSDSFEPNTTFELNSKIIGAAVYPPLNKSLNNPITVTFSHAKISSGKQICSFWNHSIREWSTQGCELDEEHSTSTKTVCLCNHLTNFALLLQREGAPYSDPPLSLKIITIIGCTLSILACILCFIMFFTLKKKDIRHYLHINLAFAIAVAQLILLFGISQTKYEILCKAMAACLHYFYMVAFLLMLCEGVHLAILIETAFSHGELKLPVYLITSWGLPLIIVGITLGVRYDNYGGSIACFLSADQGTVYAFVGPFAFIMLINFAILVIVLRQVVRKTSLPISSKTASKFEIARATIRSLIILFPVMGFTWIFGILFFGFRTLALEYLFAIFCSLQGFFIFLFQYALNTENRSAFMRATRRLRLTFSSSTHSTSANGLKHTTETKGKISSPEPPQEEDSSTKDNCHLVLYRTVDDPAGGTIDSRTTSTFI